MPANESREHFLLKQVGIVWLKIQGCQYVGAEIDGMHGGTDADFAPQSYRRYNANTGEIETYQSSRSRSVADVVGVQKRFDTYSYETRYKYTVRLIEVKVSRADFLTGYCTGAHHAYVMTPPGLVTPGELQPGIGLLEVEPELVVPTENPGRRMERIAGLVKVVRKPRRQSGLGYDPQSVIEAIAASHTNRAVFKNPWLVREVRAGDGAR